jgi:exonuclease SbcD
MVSLMHEPAGSRDDYLLVRLSDSGAILDAMGRLREVYPNLLHLERPGLERGGTLRQGGRERLRRSERELFASFFEQMTGEALLPSQQAALDSVLADLDEAAREAKQ